MKANDATTLEKTPTLREQYFGKIDNLFTDESIKFLTTEKTEALKNDKEYQDLDKQLKARKVAVCESVTNLVFCRMIARALSKEWGLSEDQILKLAISKDGRCYRNGKPYLVSTVAQAASYAVYLYGTLTKTVRKVSDKDTKVWEKYKGMKDLGMFGDTDISKKVCEYFSITKEELDKIIKHYGK